MTCGYGFSNTFFGNSTRLAYIITNGELDYYLLFPTPTLLHILISRSSTSAWGDVAFGFIVFFLAYPFSFSHFLFLCFSILISTITFTAFGSILGCLSFFLDSATLLSQQTMRVFFGFAMYPLDIFPNVLKVILLTVLPAALLGSYQANSVHNLNIFTMLYLALVPAILLSAAIVLFRLGLRRYESGAQVTYRI